MAQKKNVTAAYCPVTATEVSNSSAMSTNNGPSIRATVLFRNKAAAIIAKALAWLVAGREAVAEVMRGWPGESSDQPVMSARSARGKTERFRWRVVELRGLGPRTFPMAIGTLSQMSYELMCNCDSR